MTTSHLHASGLREHLGVPAPSDPVPGSGDEPGPDTNTTLPKPERVPTTCAAVAVSNAGEWIEGVVLDDGLLLQSLVSGPARGQGYCLLLSVLP